MKKIIFFLLLAVCTLSISAQAPSKKCPVCGLSIPKCQYKGKHPKQTQQAKPVKKSSTPKQTTQQEKPVAESVPTPESVQLEKPAMDPTTSSRTDTSVKPTTGTINGHEWVDLGLSVKWATMNVGAFSEGDYGGYYAWAETKTKSDYDWNSYFDCMDNKGSSFRIYKQGGQTQIIPASGHDVARDNWGSTWRMPTPTEMEELCNKCKWKWRIRGGHEGYLITGPSGKSIFLPAAGYCREIVSDGERLEGNYWSNSLWPSYSDCACVLYFDATVCYKDIGNRRLGMSVRPVTD